MYAVIRTGGKQYRVSTGDVIEVEQLPGEVGSGVDFSEVLMVSGDTVAVGNPTVEGAVVKGKIMAQCKGPKITVFKHKRRKSYSRKTGHRQKLTKLKIDEIIPGA
jgi:large subunit ribosomal protein L21